MATESVLQNLATELTADAQLEALNLIYARLATAPATSAKQDTGNTSLASIDTKTPALTSGRVPVTIDPAQITALTPPAAISGFATEATLSSLNAKTPALSSGSVPVTLPTAQVAALTPPAAITGYATETTSAAQLALDTAGARAIRRDADTSPVTDGQSHTLTTNAVGRLKVSSWPGAYTPITGTITTNSSVVTADVSRVSNITVELVGTFTGVNVTFETSLDGTNWKTEQGVRSNAGTIESASGVVATGLAYSWEFSVNGKNQFRVRATAYTSGTATVNISMGAYATEPIVTVPTHPVTQSGVWTISSVTPTSATAFGVTSAATTNAAVVKASTGSVYEVTISNFTGTTGYFKFYNKATAPTVGTDIPILTVMVASGTTYATDFGPLGKRFNAGISYAYTGGTGLAADTAAAVAGAQISGTYL